MSTTSETEAIPAVDQTHGMVGIYDTMAAATEAIEALSRAGIPHERLSVLTQNLHIEDTVHGFASVRDGAAATGAAGGAGFGVLFSLLSGAAFFVIPGLGPLMAAGAVVPPLVGLVEGSLGGAAVGGLVGAAMDRFVGHGHAAKAEGQLRAGKYLVLVDGDAATADRARQVLAGTEPVEVVAHSDAA